MSNTEYNNTQQFLLENSEEAQNTCFRVDFTKLFVKGDKFSILGYRNSHHGDTCEYTDLITHMRLKLKFHWWTKSGRVHFHESLLVTSWLQAVDCIFNDV